MINLVHYIRGTGQMYDLEYDILGRKGVQTLQTQYQRDPQVFYQVKDSHWESLYWDRNYIYRHADTSEGNNRYYIQMTGDKPGAVWCPADMQVGQTFERNPYLIHYYKNDGRIRTQGAFRSTIQFAHHNTHHTFPSGITLQDVVILHWVVDGRTLERYYYARGYGLVAWQSEAAGYSHICAHRSDPPGLKRERIDALADFDTETLYYCPTPCYTPKITTPGIDVSKWQGPAIDWPKVAASGVRYAFIRASYGRRPDPCFLPNIARATAAGLHTGAYHYLHAAKPIEQAAFFYDQITKAATLREADARENCVHDSPIPLVNVLDVEGKGKTPAVIKAFLDEYERLTGKKPLIYTAAHIWNNLPGDTSWAADYDLWVANYTPGPTPYLPRPWKHWVFWQHSSTFNVPGIRGHADHNRFNGTYDDLLVYLQDYWKG